ncbi:YSIRK-type signal peptide-containing protein, partial [Streptococcus suis]
MSSKDMFRKEQRFSFRKFSFGLASAVIANVIFGGAIANTPVVHANTATETAAVATSERIASIPYTVNIVDQTGKVVETKEKKVLVYTVETIATATEYLTADLVPEGYAIVSGLGEVTLTEKADNIFTVKVDKIAPEAVAPTTTAESATSETATAAATPEPASLTATQPTPVTSEVAEAEVAPTTSEESAKPTERTAYLSYITHYVNEANETVDRRGHLVAVTTTDDTAKKQVTVSASENMPSGWELVQDKAKVVVQLVENQTNILVFAVTKKSKEEEIAASQLSNKDVLEQVLSEGVLFSNDAARLLETSQAGNTGLEVATNNTKAVLKEAIQVFDEPTSTQEQVDAQTELVRAASKTLADELLKFDEDGVLTAMLDATTQAITITPSSKGAVRPNYPIHIRDFTNPSQQSYNNQDFFFGLIDKALTEEASQIRATAEATDGSTPRFSLVGGGGQPLTDANNYGLQINDSGVIYGTTTITEPGNTVSWQFQAQNGSDTARKQFTFVPYTVVKTDETPVRKGVTQGVTADEILAKVKSDVTRGNGTSSTAEATQGPLNIAFEQHFNSALTARATGTSTTVADTDKTGKQIWHEIKEYVKVAEADGTAVSVPAVTGSLPTEAGTYNVTVLSTNVHGQTIENTVKVVLNAAPTITASGTGSTNPFNNTNPERKIVYIFGITTGDTEAVTTAKAETGEKAKAPIFDSTIAKPVATITDADSTSIKVEYGDDAPKSRFNNLGSNMVATAADGTVLRDTKGNSTNVTLTDGTAKIYLGGTYEYLPGGKFTRQFIISDESNAVVRGEAFYTVSYTDKLKDDTPIAKNQDVALTEREVFAKLTLDAQSGGVSDTDPNLTVPESEVTRTIVGYRVDGAYTAQTDLTQFPKDKDFEVKVKTTNIYGQTVYNWVSVDYNLKPKVEIVDAVEGTTKTVYVFSKNNDRTENSEGVTGTNVAFDRNKATKAVVNITDDGQVTAISYTDGKSAVSDLVTNDKTLNAVIDTDGFFNGDVDALAGGSVTRVVKVTDNGNAVGDSPRFRIFPFSDTVPANVTVRLAKGTRPALEEITGKMVIDSNSGYPSNPKEAIPEDAYTRTVVGYRLDGSQDTVAVDSVEKLPTDGSYKVRVKTSNAYGQEIYNWVPVSHYKLEEISRDTVNKYTDFPAPIHAITELGSSGTVGTVKLEGDLPADFNIANFNLKEGEAAKLAERNLEFVKAGSLGTDGTVGTIQTKNGGKVEYTGSGNLDYVFEYTYQVNNENKTSNLTYTILYTDTKAPVMTPKSEYIRFVDEEYTISVPGTDNAFLSTEKINGSLSVLKDGETGKVSPGLGTNTAITSELDPKGVDVSGGVDNQGGNSTMFNVNITGTAPSAEGTGTYKLRVGENNYPAGPNVELVDGKKPENVGLTPVTVTFVKRAAMTTPVAVVDPANLTADEKAAVIAQLKKDNADNQRLQDLPDTAFTVNADGTVSVDYSAGNADVDAVTDEVANATVKLADEQKKAKDAIDTKLAEEKAAIEAKRDEAIAEINNTPGLTDDQKKAATDAVTNTANDALTDLQTAADDAKKAIDTETTVAGINDAKTAGEKALDDATATGEAAIDLTKDKELAKADVDNQAKDAIEAIKNNPNLDATEQAPYIEAIEKAAEEQKAAIDKAKDTAGITDAVNAAEKVNEEQKLAAAKEDAKDKIAEEAAAAKDAIDKDPNLTKDEIDAAKAAVAKAAEDANKAIDAATTPAEAQTAEDNGVKAIDAEELAAAKQDAKNKIAKDVEAA